MLCFNALCISFVYFSELFCLKLRLKFKNCSNIRGELPIVQSVSGYGGYQYVPSAQFPSARQQSRKICGYREHVIPPTDIQTCTPTSLPNTDYQFFLPQLWRHVTFSGTGSSVAYHDEIRTVRLYLDKSMTSICIMTK